jgi:hypothetical protein
MTRVWRTALENNSNAFLALEEHAGSLDALLKKQDRLMAYAGRIAQESRFTLSLAMEGDALMQSTSLVKLHFDASRGGHHKIAMEEVSGGVIAMIVAAFVAVAALIWKFVKWVKGGSYSSGGGGGGFSGGSSMTKEEVQKTETAAKEVASVVESVVHQAPETFKTDVATSEGSNTQKNVSPELKKLLDEAHAIETSIPTHVLAVYGSHRNRITKTMAKLVGLTKEVEEVQDKLTAEVQHITKTGFRVDTIDANSSAEDVGKATESTKALVAVFEKYAPKKTELSKAIQETLKEFDEAISSPAAVGVNAAWITSFGSALKEAFSDPHQIEFAVCKEAAAQALEEQAKHYFNVPESEIKKEIEDLESFPELHGIAVKIMRGTVADAHQSLTMTARMSRAIGQYQKALIDGAGEVAKILDNIEKQYRLAVKENRDEKGVSTELADDCKAAAEMCREFHKNPTAFTKKS